MRKQPLKFDGVTLEHIVTLPCAVNEFPSWCDVYIRGQLVFENVLVEFTQFGLNLFNGFHEEMSGTHLVSKTTDYSKRVAIVKSNEFFVVARRSDKRI